MSFSELISPLIGRAMLAWFFLSAALDYAGRWHGTITMLAMQNVPAPPLLAAIGIIVMLIGGISLLFGFHARYGAMLLFSFTLLASIMMHDYWHIKDAATRDADYQLFARNIAIAGALLFIAAVGSGPLSIDNQLNAPKKKR